MKNERWMRADDFVFWTIEKSNEMGRSQKKWKSRTPPSLVRDDRKTDNTLNRK